MSRSSENIKAPEVVFDAAKLATLKPSIKQLAADLMQNIEGADVTDNAIECTLVSPEANEQWVTVSIENTGLASVKYTVHYEELAIIDENDTDETAEVCRTIISNSILPDAEVNFSYSSYFFCIEIARSVKDEQELQMFIEYIMKMKPKMPELIAEAKSSAESMARIVKIQSQITNYLAQQPANLLDAEAALDTFLEGIKCEREATESTNE